MRIALGLLGRSAVLLATLASAAPGRCQEATSATRGQAPLQSSALGHVDWASMPTTQHVSGLPWMSGSTLPASGTTYSIRRTQPEMQEAAPVNLPAVDVEPLPMVSVDEPVKYSTVKMTGPLQDASALFNNLQIQNDFRFAPTVADDATLPLGIDGYRVDRSFESYAWLTPTFSHRPLYFEQVNLERYGIGPRRCLQPVASAGHFFGSVLLMPYKWLAEFPGEPVYTLGNNRPGDCVPYQRCSLLGQSYPFEALHFFRAH